MKKIFTYCLAIASLLFAATSCKDGDSDLYKEYTLLDFVKEDYAAIVAKTPDFKDHFVEARFTLENNISEVPVSELKAEELQTICAFWINGHSEIFIRTRDFKTDKVTDTSYSIDSPWFGDKHITGENLMSLGISLEAALAKALKEAGSGDGLNTRYVTLRQPLWPTWPNPQYVVGGSASRNDHVFIDAKTGKVSIEEMPIPEGSAQAFVVDDYNRMIDEYSTYEHMGYRVYLQEKIVAIEYILDNPVNKAMLTDLEVKQMSYVFYEPADAAAAKPAYLIRGIRKSFQYGSPLEYEETTLASPYTEKKWFASDYLIKSISINDAITTVKLSNVTDPDTDQVTFYVPEGSETPVYLFKGSHTPSVTVDALTGDILE